MQDKRYGKFEAVLFFVFLLFTTFYPLLTVRAAAYSVSPVVIDMKGKARDILSEKVILKNETSRLTYVYAFVNNLDVKKGEQEFLDPSAADHASSFANWISVTRGAIELGPYETKTLDVGVAVNLAAEPGAYHAVISFAEGSSRGSAEALLVSAPRVTLNLEVEDDAHTAIQLTRFVPEKTFFTDFPISFKYEFMNVGTTEAAPHGEIRVYDRRGREVTALLAENKRAIAPKETADLSGVWSGGALAIGRYKAVLDLRYPDGTSAAQDTVFFWVVPLQKLLLIFAVFLGLSVFGAVVLHRFYEMRYARRLTAGGEEEAYMPAKEIGLFREASASPVLLYVHSEPEEREGGEDDAGEELSGVVDLRNKKKK